MKHGWKSLLTREIKRKNVPDRMSYFRPESIDSLLSGHVESTHIRNLTS